jgi:eukaryotic-like serine/threonine-protein kinase
MSAENRQQVRRVFMEVAGLPEADRGAELVRACGGDAVLRAGVETLLRADRDAGGFMGSPTAVVRNAGATISPTPAEQPGEMIGRYRLLEPIGEGGFGSVWMAEQREPVKRRVALKIIKLGMDTRQVIARFEAERQALAMMDHPNIAKVLDAGATETGRPYFVMEYIRGVPILEHCDTEKLDTKARLELFSSVCHAIQHAHQKGIIHRDIKPSNVLVTMHDGVALPKVIDFGIAKATGSELTVKTLFTEHRQMIGTPAYMSPEQAEMSGLDIDTRSDIYALGVLLYELLTGTTPFDSEELMSKGFAEMMRIIREVEPAKPSTRLSSLGDTGARTAQQRDMGDIRKLGLNLRGDLDWIVMKCLEKDRTRRYETANGLAADIQRHMNDEPVTAGPPGAAYRLRKFAKRNRAQVIAGGIVAGALVLGVVGTTAGMVWALNESTKATLAAESETKARKAAERISEFMTAALRAGDAEMSGREGGTEGAGRDMTILAAMDSAIKDVDSGRFKDDPETEAGVRTTIGIILRSNGKYDQAKPLLEQALAVRERLFKGDDLMVAGSLFNLAEVYRAQGQYAQAEPLYTRALAIREKILGPDHSSVAQCLNSLAALYRAQGHYAQAEPLFTRALAIYERALGPDDAEVAHTLNSMAVFYKVQGRYAQAEPLYTRALEIYERAFGPDHPAVANGLSNRANLYNSNPDQFAQAEPLLLRALAIREKAFGPDHPGVAMTLNNLGALYMRQGGHAEAEPILLRAVAIYERALGRDHPDVLTAKGSLASLYWSQGKLDKSVPLLEAVLQAGEKKLGRQHPITLHTVANLGVNYMGAGRLTDAIPLLEEAHRASKQNPLLAFAGRALASIYRDQGRFVEAESLDIETLAITEKAFGPDHPDVLKAKGNLASLYWSQGKLDKSVPLFEEVLRAREPKLGRQHPDTLTTMGNLGVNYMDAGRLRDAIPLLEEAYRASKRYPQLCFVWPALLHAYTSSADPAKPESTARVEVLMPEMLAAARGTLPEGSLELAAQLASLGQTQLTLKAWHEAEPLIREALTTREAKAPDDWRTFYTRSLLGGALLGQDQLAEAEPLLLDGYRGMKEREATIHAHGKARIPEVIERVARLYEAKGNEPEAAAWRSKLEAARAELRKPDAKGGGG